jgi:hypothetical protein
MVMAETINYQSSNEMKMYTSENGVTLEVMLNAATWYLYSLLAQNGELSVDQRLCLYDQDLIHYAHYVRLMMPNSKIILVMHNDTAEVITHRPADLRTQDKDNYKYYHLRKNSFLQTNCKHDGSSSCLLVENDQFESSQNEMMRRVLAFIQVSNS